MEGTRRLTAIDVREEALKFVLASGENTVCWDDCELIWDSTDLVSESPQENSQVAVFGVKGRLSTPQHELRPFLLKHSFEFGTERGYFMKAAIGTGPNDSTQATAEIQPKKVPGDQGLQDFQRVVLQLTKQVQTVGVLETMKTFLTLKMLNGTG